MFQLLCYVFDQLELIKVHVLSDMARTKTTKRPLPTPSEAELRHMRAFTLLGGELKVYRMLLSLQLRRRESLLLRVRHRLLLCKWQSILLILLVLSPPVSLRGHQRYRSQRWQQTLYRFRLSHRFLGGRRTYHSSTIKQTTSHHRRGMPF